MGNLVTSIVSKFGVFFTMLLVVALITTALLIITDPVKNIDDEDELERLYKKFVKRARRAFGRKGSKTLEGIFREQCTTAKQDLVCSKELIKKSSGDNGRSSVCREFERSFLCYAREVTTMDMVVKAEIMSKLEKGQKILKNFEHYLDIFRIVARSCPHPLGASGAHFHVKI